MDTSIYYITFNLAVSISTTQDDKKCDSMWICAFTYTHAYLLYLMIDLDNVDWLQYFQLLLTNECPKHHQHLPHRFLDIARKILLKKLGYYSIAMHMHTGSIRHCIVNYFRRAFTSISLLNNLEWPLLKIYAFCRFSH